MVKVKPFKGIRPPKEFVVEVSSRPYDVLTSEEARAASLDREKSLYHIIKPEIDFPKGMDPHDPAIYSQSVNNFKKFKEKGWLVQDKRECYYIYAQTMRGKTQYGLVLGAYVPDYLEGKIKRHELTRSEKEADRVELLRANGANIEPVFFAYPDHPGIDAIVRKYSTRQPEYDFVVKSDGYRHTLWIVDDCDDIDRITALFAEVPSMYIADGHHRTAAAAVIGEERANQNPNHTGEEEYNYFMAVCFPTNQLTILDYNRIVKDLNGMSDDEFLRKLSEHFTVEEKGEEMSKPAALHHFSLYLSGKWFALEAKADAYDEKDPIGVLDVSICSNLILRDLLGITDLRTDDRVDFVGGNRGLQELKRRVDSGEMRLGIALYPVTMHQLMEIADTGNIMPPKTSWFEPKLRSGLVIHSLDR